MGTVWLKIKIWTKGILFGCLILYATLFLYNNSAVPSVKFWYWFGREPETSPLLLALIAFLAGVVMTILVRTTFKTIGQIRELRSRQRLERIEREHADMKMKAAMLQTRTAPTPSAVKYPSPESANPTISDTE